MIATPLQQPSRHAPVPYHSCRCSTFTYLTEEFEPREDARSGYAPHHLLRAAYLPASEGIYVLSSVSRWESSQTRYSQQLLPSINQLLPMSSFCTRLNLFSQCSHAAKVAEFCTSAKEIIDRVPTLRLRFPKQIMALPMGAALPKGCVLVPGKNISEQYET